MTDRALLKRLAGLPGRLAAGLQRWTKRNRLNLLLAALVAAILLVVLWNRMVITIPPGSIGVLWLRLGGGTQIDFHYDAGLKVIAPWDKIYIYDARLQRLDDKVHALTRDGLVAEIEVTTSHAVDRDLIGRLHERLGPEYQTTIIQPVVGAEIRNAVAELRPDDLYSLNRVTLAQAVARGIRTALTRNVLDVVNGRPMIIVQDLFIRNISLPPLVQVAIEQKITEEQNALAYHFTLERERLESQRKAVEAQGIRQFQEIVSSGISEPYLRWRGIEATLQLARSANSKVVVIGGQGGLPLILDIGERTQQGTGSTAAQERDAAARTAPQPEPASQAASQPESQAAPQPEPGK